MGSLFYFLFVTQDSLRSHRQRSTEFSGCGTEIGGRSLIGRWSVEVRGTVVRGGFFFSVGQPWAKPLPTAELTACAGALCCHPTRGNPWCLPCLLSPWVQREGGLATPGYLPPRDAIEGKGPQRRPQKRLNGRLEEVAKAVGGGYCRLHMLLKLALAIRETVAGHRLGALEGYAPPPLSPMHPCSPWWGHSKPAPFSHSNPSHPKPQGACTRAATDSCAWLRRARGQQQELCAGAAAGSHGPGSGPPTRLWGTRPCLFLSGVPAPPPPLASWFPH